MKKSIVPWLLSAVFLGLAMPIALADTVPTNALPLSKILETLETKGYIVFREIEFEDGAYETNVFNAEGEHVKLRINPQTGKILEPEQAVTTLSLLDVVRRIENAGYHSIAKVSFERGVYEVNALDPDNKTVELDVDGKTGAISKDWL